MKLGFDIISDLWLNPNDNFNWENKATSLYCIIAGNISNDTRTIAQTLLHLTRFYQGIVYIPGILEYKNVPSVNERTKELSHICGGIKGVTFLYHHVVIVDGVAIVGSNGWYGFKGNLIEEAVADIKRAEDLSYLHATIKKLQVHLDVKQILIVSNSVPNNKLFFGEDPEFIKDQLSLDTVLVTDTQKKVKYWVFGTHEKIVDTTIDNINYLNNPYYKKTPYWAKRLEIKV